MFKFEKEELDVTFTQYFDGNLAVCLTCSEGPYATVSVNLSESSSLPRDCFYAKHWDNQLRIISAMRESGIIKERLDIPEVNSGFIKNIRAYQVNDEYKKVCDICENWVEELTKCSCGYEFCRVCGSKSEGLCIICQDPDNVSDVDEDFSEDESGSEIQ